MKPLPIEERCQEKVSGTGPWGAFHQHQCEKKAIVARNGKRYCKVHDPEYVEAKNKTRTEKWKQDVAKRHLEYKAPMLLDACKRALEASHDPAVEQILQEAIDRAEKE